MKEVRVAIVGMGIGRPNAKGITRNPRGRVVALCDLLEDRMQEFAQELPEPVKLYTDYHEMCRDPEIDAVFVGTPNQFHVPVALEAIRNDKHVMVTKPLADSVEAAQTLVDAAEASGLVNMMSLSTRFSDPVQYLGKLRAEGEFGELYYGRARSVRRQGIPAWSLGFIQKGGGAFRDMGVHVLDSAWWLLGMPKPVSVTGVSGAKFGPRGQGYFGREFMPLSELASHYNSDDYGGGFIRFENGLGLQIESFWASHQPGDLQIELFGTEAGARLDPLTIYRTINGAEQDISVNVKKDQWSIAWDTIAEHFLSSILDGTECAAPLRHGLIVQEMMEGLLESAKTGQEVRL
ncbi:Gfo/Idh/MocA family oxidoreductase [Chloroflexi bacterium TSY]|nr:Gfo/Idh/MocA family oxidoreductase [Chloroflexi bacterium TSY]